MFLWIIAEFGLEKITKSLTACKMLQCMMLRRGNASRVFTDYGKNVTYACVGPQPSRNSKIVRSHPPFMQALPNSLWRTLVWMMNCAESTFRLVANHSVLSHLHLAKKLVPFNTFTLAKPDNPLTFNAQFLEVSLLGRMFFFIATRMMISRWVLFRCSSRENVNICLTMRLLYIFVFLRLVSPSPYGLEITYCSMLAYLIVFLLDAKSKKRYCAPQLTWKRPLSWWITTIFH